MRASCWLVLEPHRTRYNRDEFKIIGARQSRPTDKPAVKVTIELPDNAFQWEAPEVVVAAEPHTWVVKFDELSEIQSTPTIGENETTDPMPNTMTAHG